MYYASPTKSSHGQVHKKKLRYIKTLIFFWIKCLKVVAKCCLNLISFYLPLYCCARHPNIEYQYEIFNPFH